MMLGNPCSLKGVHGTPHTKATCAPTVTVHTAGPLPHKALAILPNTKQLPVHPKRAPDAIPVTHVYKDLEALCVLDGPLKRKDVGLGRARCVEVTDACCRHRLEFLKHARVGRPATVNRLISADLRLVSQAVESAAVPPADSLAE